MSFICVGLVRGLECIWSAEVRVWRRSVVAAQVRMAAQDRMAAQVRVCDGAGGGGGAGWGVGVAACG